MFEKVTPESVGVSSKDVLDLLQMLDEYRFQTHGIMMLKGNKLFCEAHYEPFSKDFLHRMYSVSKTFVAISTGLAITEGLIGYDDVIVDYFPEFALDSAEDEMYQRCTVRDMLSMQSNISDNVYWWGKFESRIRAYYTQKTTKVPGTIYCYDSIGSFLLGCIIEKLTGKDFLEYLKEKVLCEIGFSKESYVLKEPGGYAIGDSGVMCTINDFALFARFIMQKGEWNGKQYIDREFMEEAVKKQVSNDFEGAVLSCTKMGYGYLIWRTPNDTYALVGAGDQYAICDPNHDFLFVITSDNQLVAGGESRQILFHEVCKHFVDKINDEALPEDSVAQKQLEEYTASCKLLVQYGEVTEAIAKDTNKRRYVAKENAMNISEFCVVADDKEGYLDFVMNGKPFRIDFGIGENKFYDFSFGTRAVLDMMGKNEEGKYKCAASAAWVDKTTFAIHLQVIDTYFGGLNVHISYKDEYATMKLTKSGQYVFDGIGGYIIGRMADN